MLDFWHWQRPSREELVCCGGSPANLGRAEGLALFAWLPGRQEFPALDGDEYRRRYEADRQEEAD
eukprot:5236827-Lingulodinium_polyedra.AAC.1